MHKLKINIYYINTFIIIYIQHEKQLNYRYLAILVKSYYLYKHLTQIIK